MIAQYVSVRPARANSRYVGTVRAAAGIIIAPRVMANNAALPGNWYLAKAYPAAVDRKAAPTALIHIGMRSQTTGGYRRRLVIPPSTRRMVPVVDPAKGDASHAI